MLHYYEPHRSNLGSLPKTIRYEIHVLGMQLFPFFYSFDILLGESQPYWLLRRPHFQKKHG